MIINSFLNSSLQKFNKQNSDSQKLMRVEVNKSFTDKHVKFSVHHLRANTLSFGIYNGNHKPDNTTVKRGPNPVERQGEEIVKSVASGNRPPGSGNDTPEFPCYKKPAEKIAVYLATGNDTNMIIPHGDGSAPELLVNNFKKMMYNGEFKNIGITPENTNVSVLNIAHEELLAQKNMEKVNNSSLQLVHALDEVVKDNKQQIVFVENMSDFVNLMNGGNPFEMNTHFNSGKFKDVHVVGLIQNDLYKEMTEKTDNPNSSTTKAQNQWLKHFKEFKLSSIGSNQAKEMLKNEEIRNHLLTDDFNRAKFTDESIDKAVDITKILAGEFPKKAVDLMKRAAVHKMKETGQPVQNLEINVHDINEAYKQYPEYNELKYSDSGIFKVSEGTSKTFDDVGGIKEVRKKLQEEIIDYIKDPERFKGSGSKILKGALLFGPPGTGKTLLAKAIAGEAGVPFVSASASTFVEKFVGTGAARVRELFSLARDEARKSDQKTAIVFIDEFDAVGGAREGNGGNSNSEREQTLNQILTEMDGFETDDDINIVVLAATNRPDKLDEAAIRTGRFDRKFEVPNPAGNVSARREIFEIHSRNKRFKSIEDKKKILDEMAESTDGLSGSDIEGIMNIAAQATSKKGRKDPNINIADLKKAKIEQQLGEIKEIDQPEHVVKETKGHECGHGLCNLVIKNAAENPKQKPVFDIDTFVLEPRGKALACVLFKPSKENTEHSFESTIAQIITGYGGYSVEKELYDGNTAGVTNDLKQSTQIATVAVEKWGLGHNVGRQYIDETNRHQYVKEIKLDTKLFTDTAEVISDKITKFHKGFINQFVEDAENGKLDKHLSGEEFTEYYNNWVESEGKHDDLKKLHKEIRDIMYEAKKGKNVKEETKYRPKQKMGFL